MKERGKEQRGMKRGWKGEVSFGARLCSVFRLLHPLYQFPAIFLHLAKHQFHFFFFLIFFLFLLPLLKPLFPSQMSFSLCHSFVFSQTLHSTYNSHPIRSIKQKRKRKLQFPHKWLNNLNQFFVDCTKSILEQSFSIFRL